MRTHIYAVLTLIIYVLVSCKKDVNICPHYSGNASEIEASITVISEKEDIISKSSPLTDNIISDVSILVFDVYGNLLKTFYFNELSHITIKCSSGYKTIVAIANVGNVDFSSYGTLEAIRHALTDNMANNQSQCIMTGETACNLKNGDNIIINLIRLISKISIVFNKDQLEEGTSVVIQKISLKNVPLSCTFLSDNKADALNGVSESGDYIDTKLEPSNHQNATPLFMFENLQGNIGTATEEFSKSPGNAAPFCSYIEILANYQNKARQGSIKYRFYLGNNITNNFDVKRNRWYQLNVIFKEDAINEVSWRIDTTEISDVLYLINTLSQPEDGGTIGGGGYYKYGSLPNLTAIPNTNYIFKGWTPTLAPVTENRSYTAVFLYTDPTVHVTGVTLSKDTLNLDIGSSEHLTANILPDNANNKNLVWSSENTNIAEVDQNGNVSGMSTGTTSISVMTCDGGYTANCIIKVFQTIKLHFHIERTAKVEYKEEGGGYWCLCEPIRDDIYVRSKGGDGILGTISYTINWAYDPSSGFDQPETINATKAITISNTLHKLLESGNAWGRETDFSINYPNITVTGISPSIMPNPPTKIYVDQSINTYHYIEIGK